LRYRLYTDGVADAARLAADVEAALAAGHPYRYARALGQLAAVEPVVVRGAAARYEAWRSERGQRAGDVKVPALCGDDGVHDVLGALRHEGEPR
jgi:hypothetical protein